MRGELGSSEGERGVVADGDQIVGTGFFASERGVISLHLSSISLTVSTTLALSAMRVSSVSSFGERRMRTGPRTTACSPNRAR